MKRLNLLLILVVLLFLQNITKAQFPTFTRIDTSIICTIGGSSNSGHWGDFNNDGLEDLIIANMSYTKDSFNHFLFINQGDWLFTQVTDGAIAEYVTSYGSHGACWGDYNNDGHLDLFIASIYNENNLLFQNNGDATFAKILEGVIVNDEGDSGPAVWVDIDNDGYLDLYVTNQETQKNFLYLNQGGEGFRKITEGDLVNFVEDIDVGSAWADIDNDRDQDAYCFGWERGVNEFQYLLTNDGNGNLTSETSSNIVNLDKIFYNVDWGDYNNDGYIDLYIPAYGTGSETNNDMLFRNTGEGTFEQVTGMAPVNEERTTSWSNWADLDNNGFLDLLLIDWDDNTKNTIFSNNGGTFQEILLTDDLLGGSVPVDINLDGFLDIFVLRGYAGSLPAENIIYANDGNSNSWIIVKPVGTVSNKSAIGTRIKVKATIYGSPVWQVRETGLNGSRLNAHFGFGDATQIDSLVVQWPAGHDTVLTNVAVNQFMTITEEIPSGYLRASFAVDTTIGRGELTVKFKDISRFDPAHPVTYWSWDLNGDGNEDSDEQNPIFTYINGEGEVYDVSLTISNGIDTAKITKKECIRIYPVICKSLNLAICYAKATASSLEYPVLKAQNAIDDELLSRWGSDTTESTSWLKVELDSVYEICKVVIVWRPAYAKEYEIQTSLDDSNWETVYSENSGNGSVDIINFSPIEAKYIRINCLKKVMVSDRYWGYSIQEFKIYQTNCVTGILNRRQPDTKLSVYPNPFNESVTFSFVLERSADVQLSINDLCGRKIVNVHNGRLDAGHQQIVWERTNIYGKRVKPGYYLYKLIISDNSDDLKLNGKLLIAY